MVYKTIAIGHYATGALYLGNLFMPQHNRGVEVNSTSIMPKFRVHRHEKYYLTAARFVALASIFCESLTRERRISSAHKTLFLSALLIKHLLLFSSPMTICSRLVI